MYLSSLYNQHNIRWCNQLQSVSTLPGVQDQLHVQALPLPLLQPGVFREALAPASIVANRGQAILINYRNWLTNTNFKTLVKENAQHWCIIPSIALTWIHTMRKMMWRDLWHCLDMHLQWARKNSLPSCFSFHLVFGAQKFEWYRMIFYSCTQTYYSFFWCFGDWVNLINLHIPIHIFGIIKILQWIFLGLDLDSWLRLNIPIKVKKIKFIKNQKTT